MRYELTQTEERLLTRFRQLQEVSQSTRTPRTLFVMLTTSTVQFWEGHPAGVSAADRTGEASEKPGPS